MPKVNGRSAAQDLDGPTCRATFFLLAGFLFIVVLIVLLSLGDEEWAVAALGFALAMLSAFLAEETDRSVAKLDLRLVELETAVAEIQGKAPPAAPARKRWWQFWK